MVSARLKKRFIALMFLSSIAVVFLYKIQQLRDSDYIAAGFKQTKDFSRWVLRTISVKCYIGVSRSPAQSFNTYHCYLDGCLIASKVYSSKADTGSRAVVFSAVILALVGAHIGIIRYLESLFDWICSDPLRFTALMCLWNHYLVLHFTSYPQLNVLRKFF